MIIVGVDPDVKKNGVAVYDSGNLVSLHNWSFKDYTTNLLNNCFSDDKDNVVIVIECGLLIKGIYSTHKSSKDSMGTYAKKIRDVGRNNQVGECLCSVTEALGYKLIREKPMRGNFAKDKARFEKITKWTKQSNEETRSAAFFGCLYKDLKDNYYERVKNI